MIGVLVPSVANSYSSYGFTSDTGFDFILNNGLYMGDDSWGSGYPTFQKKLLGFNNVSDVYAYIVRNNNNELRILTISLSPFNDNVRANNLRGSSKETIICPHTPFDRIVDGVTYSIYGAGSYVGSLLEGTVPSGMTILESDEVAIRDLINSITQYPITYHYTNSTVSGPTEAAAGDIVTVSAVPDNNYGITDVASQILVTNNDVSIPYNWNPSTNTITFTMPDPT